MEDTAWVFAREFCRAWAHAGRDLDSFMQYFSDDTKVELMVCGSTLSEVRGPFSKAQWRAQTAREASAGDLNVLIDNVWGAAHAIVIEATGDLQIASTAYKNKYCFILEIDAAGKVKNMRTYLDTLYAREIFTTLQASAGAIDWQSDASGT